MIKSRNELEQVLQKAFKVLSINTEKCQKIYFDIKRKHGISISETSDIILMRKELSGCSEFILFCILEAIDPNQINKFYTVEEQQWYEKEKFEKKKLKLPFYIPDMIQISNDQWIGKITAKQLMEYRSLQLINYNANAQRTLRHIIDGQKEYYKIMLNKKSINEIKFSMSNKVYIPNTITLNIPETTGFVYLDQDYKMKIINNFDHFDIIDGYHRYIAISELVEENVDINEINNMELRITCFSEEKAQQFIYQEDQKTKMRKIDSESLNQNKPSNIVIQRLNEDPRCNVRGMIGRNGCKIPAGEASMIISKFFFDGVKKENERAKIIEVSKILREKFNIITEDDQNFLTMEYSYRDLIAILYMFASDVESTRLTGAVKEAMIIVNNMDNKLFKTKVLKKKECSALEMALKDVR